MMKTQRQLLLALVLLDSLTVAFWASLPKRPSAEMLSMAPLSNEEIFARTAQQKEEALLDQEPPPMLFDEDLLDDMQAALLLLEKRVQEGPLTTTEVDQLVQQFDRIKTEMRVNEHKKPQKPAPSVEVATTAAPIAVVQPHATPQDAPEPSSSEEVATSRATVNAAPKVIDIDTPSDEGAEYNGRGGMGQAADTTNTYVIPGMEDMSPEEYQVALQSSVIDRQRRRKESGVTGNRASWDYLKQLQYPSEGMEK